MIPCAVSERWSMFDSSRSKPTAMRGRNSRIVTSDPSRAQTDPSSRPIAPAPTTRNLGGASTKVSASVLLTIVLPSNFANGSSIAALPVAMTIFFVSISCCSPLDDLTETLPGAVIVPNPSNVVTLFVFMSARTPLFIVLTTLSLRCCIFARSTLAFSMIIPCFPASFFANTK